MSARIAAQATPYVINGNDPVNVSSFRAATIDSAKLAIAIRTPTAKIRYPR